MGLEVPPGYTPAARSGHGREETAGADVIKDDRGNHVKVYIDRTNRRLKIVNYKIRDWETVCRRLEETAGRHSLGKILFTSRRSDNHVLSQCGYVLEGIIPSFFNGQDALCYSLFTDPARARSAYWEKEEEMLKAITRGGNRVKAKELPAGFKMTRINLVQVEELVELYRKIFRSYPSPLLSPEYVNRVMQSHVTFYGAFTGDRLVSAASAEADLSNRNAEITDCATLPEYRGKGLLNNLIRILEKEMRVQGTSVLYSLARAGSYGMNAVLYRLGYEYRGRFINNCHIDGRFEDMNLWVKTL